MTEGLDVIVLGTGNAGMAAARLAREAGQSVAMVESRETGGTCPLRGCVPKKVLVAAAQVLHQIDAAKDHHISVGRPVLDWAALMTRERTFVDGVAEAFTQTIKNREVALYRGAARFTGSHEIEVEGQALTAKKIVIATGSTPRPLPIPGSEHLITSDDILEMFDLPRELVFVGGGVIALEFSHVLARAGCKVTILEAAPRLLPRNDVDAVDRLDAETRRLGVDVCTGVKINAIHIEKGRPCVAFELGGEMMAKPADKVANGTGRVPAVAHLDLDAGGIEAEGLRIKVDEHLRSVSNPDVYVAGDALAGTAQLSPVATYEGTVVGKNLVDGDEHVVNEWGIPSAVYTVPAFASVGYTEEQAKESGKDFEVKINDMADWRSSRTYAETVAYAKTLIEKGTDRILGAHIIGHGAEEIIHLIGYNMRHGHKAQDLKDLVYAYPTFSSDLKFLV